MENLKFIRKYNKMTQKEVAASLGISRATYTQYETNVSEPTFKTISKLMKLFNTPIDFLLDLPPFDNFPRVYLHKELILKSLNGFSNGSLSSIIPIAKDNIHDFITLLSVSLSKIEFLGDDSYPTVTLFPLIPQESFNSLALETYQCLTDNFSDDEFNLIKNYRNAAPADRIAVNSILSKYGEAAAK